MKIKQQKQTNQNKKYKTKQSKQSRQAGQTRQIRTKINQKGGFKPIDDRNSDEFKKLFIYITTNLKEFTKQYKKFLETQPLFKGLLGIINATQTLAKVHNKIKYLINIELLNVIALKLLDSFQINKRDQEGKYKFLNRLAYKITNDYLNSGTDIQKDEREKKRELYVDQLSIFLNENVFHHVNITCDFMFVKDFSRFQYIILNEEEAIAKISSKSERSSRLSHSLSRRSEENEEV
jgi:hypothetical protein